MNRREAINRLFYAISSLMFTGVSVNFKFSSRDLHVIGLGVAGCNMLEYIHSLGLQALYTCISWPLRPHLPAGISFIECRPSVQVFKDNLSSESYVSSDFRILDIVRRNDYFVLLSGLGGDTGSNLTRQLSKLMSLKGKRHMLICQSPFSFEGIDRCHLAAVTLTDLQNTSRVYSFGLDSFNDLYGDLKLSAVLCKADEFCYMTLKNRLLHSLF